MGDFPHYFDIILFAMVAAFLVLRLRSVLGRRTGNERRRPGVVRQAEPPRDQIPADKVIAFDQRPNGVAPPATTEPAGDAVAAGLARIHDADPSFDPPHFLEGARAAFDMIVAAFAEGDKAKLRPLLSLALKQLDIVAAELDGRIARVTLKLVSDQINVLRAHDGSVVDGDPEHAIEKTDFWTFARDTRLTDPNWVLVATDGG